MSLKRIIPGMVIGFTLIPTLLAIILSSQVLIRNLNERVSSHVDAMAEQQGLRLTDLFKQQASLVSFLAENSITQRNFRAFNAALHNQNVQVTEQGIKQNRDVESSRLFDTLQVIGDAQYQHLAQYIGTLGLQSVWVVNNEGLIYQTSSQKQPVLDQALTLFKESDPFSVWLKKQITSPPEQPGIRLMRVGADWYIAAVTQVYSLDRLQGSLLALFQLEPIHEIIDHWQGKGWTGRSYLAVDELGFLYVQDNQIQVKFMDQNYQENSQPIYTNFNGQAVFGSQRKLDFHQNRWRIFSEITVEEINIENRTLIRKLLLMGVAVSFLALGVGIMLSRRIVYSLEQISASARRLSDGNYTIKIPHGGPSEIDALSKVLDELRKQLLSKIESLKISNTSLEAEIDRRKKIENSLREDNDFINNLTNSMVDVVFSVRIPEREIEWVNDSFKLFGYDPDVCIGKTTEFLYPDRAVFLATGNIMAEFIADDDREILHIEQMFKKKDGELFPTDLTITKNRVNKEVVSITGIMRDITERKKAEAELKAYQVRLKALSSQLTLAEDKERSRIATDLHDNIGQTLAFTRIKVAKAKKYAPEGELATILDEISQSLFRTIKDTKELIFDLSPPLLHEIGLAAAISNWLEEQVGRKHSMEVKFVYSGEELPLSKDLKSKLFRNVRELLSNVIKHAQATEVVVTLVARAEELLIIVRDDGIGFDYDSKIILIGVDSGFGLFSVKQQIESFGGKLEIDSKPGKGCKVSLTVPLKT